MAWTAPRTWVAGEVVTASLMNTHIRDNEKMLSDSWAAYTTTWTSSGGGAAVGNGSLTAFAAIVNKWVRFRILLTYGTTSNAGTGTWQFTLPGSSVTGRGSLGTAACFDTSAALLYPRNVFQNGTGTLVVADMTPTRIGGTSPFTWASGDELNIIGEYEAA